MFRPNQIAMVSRPGARNLYGEQIYEPQMPVPCAVVKLIKTRRKTTVRADSSASRGNSAEVVSNSKLLFDPRFEIMLEDRVQIAGCTLRVIAVHPRFAVNTKGKVDHYEVDLETWFD